MPTMHPKEAKYPNTSKKVKGPSNNFERMFKTSEVEYLNKVNSHCLEALDKIKRLKLKPFNNALNDENTDVQVSSTIAHRFINKFEKPSLENEQTLKQECFDQWVEWETDYLQKEQLYQNIKKLTLSQRAKLYAAQQLIGDWLRGFKCQLKNVDIEIPPGESYTPSEGYVSVYQKLRKKQHWTVTWNCLEDSVFLIYHNVSLKRCAKYWFSNDKDYQRALYDNFKHRPDIGFAVFRQQMIDHVFTIVDGSRGSSVYKNIEKRRFINVEATFSVILQRLLAKFIRKRVSVQGNSLKIGQSKHKMLIKNKRYATIDFSNASDSNHYDTTYFMLDRVPKFREKVLEWRSYQTKLGPVWHIPQKTSSMGNGFTFELMTVILLSVARTLSIDSFVYGDDVIIPNDHATDFITIVECLGWRVNNTKTFLNSTLRESCGAFYSDGYGYITCYDIQWCENPADVVVLCNKLYRITRELKISGVLTSSVFEILSKLRTDLIACSPTLLKGFQYYDLDVLNTHIWVDDPERLHRNNERARTLYVRNRCLIQEANAAQMITPEKYVIVCTPIFRPKLGSTMRNTYRLVGAGFASALYANRRVKDVIRNEGEWYYSLSYSGDTFSHTSLASLKLLLRQQ